MSDPEVRPVRTAVSATTTLAVIVAVVAVALGFLILKDLGDSGTSGVPSGDPVATSSTTPAATTTTTSLAPTSTTLLTTGFEVLVANASGVPQSAGKLTEQLKGKGYSMAEPTNGSSTGGTLTETIVYYQPGFEDAATSVATVLGGKTTQPIPEVVPTEDGSMGTANVLVMLGTDQAGKRLPKRTG